MRATLVALSVFAASAMAACDAATRLKYARQVVTAYGQVHETAVVEGFSTIPFGAPDLNGVCSTIMYVMTGPQ
jgi:hypothetical protein